MMNISEAMVSQEKLDIEVFSSGFEKTLQDNGIFISLLISMLLIILSLTEFHISNKELEIIKQICIKDFTKTDYDKILYHQDWLLKGFLTICMLYIIFAVIVSNIFPLMWSLPIGISLILIIQYMIYTLYKNHIIK